MSPSAFANEQLGIIRRTFFADAIDSEFYQERNLLLQAIAYPAKWLNEHGAKAPASLYRGILRTVIETIKKHGKPDRFSVYFLHCVQEHMKHHGEDYYTQAKAARRAADFLPAVMRKVQVGEADETTKVLAEMHRTLALRSGRKKNAPLAAKQRLLFR